MHTSCTRAHAGLLPRAESSPQRPRICRRPSTWPFSTLPRFLTVPRKYGAGEAEPRSLLPEICSLADKVAQRPPATFTSVGNRGDTQSRRDVAARDEGVLTGVLATRQVS